MNTPRPLAALPPILMLLLLGCGQGNRVIRSLGDAKHAKIGVMTGTTGEAIAKARYPQAEIKSFDDVMDAIGAMKAGQLEAVITSYSTGVQVAKKNPELAPLPEPLSYEGSSIGLRKGNEELLAALNQAIAEMRNDGTLDAMSKRWFKPDLSPYDEPLIKMPTEGTPLKIGTSATREPFIFVDRDGRVTGYDGELSRRIAAKLHRPIEFSNMKFMALIPALQSGKIDMIVSGMTATNERKQFVDFTQSYFENKQIMLVAKAPIPSHASSLKMASTADISNKKIGVVLGYVHDTYAARTYPNAKILQYHNEADLALGVKTGKVDAALLGDVPVQELVSDDPALGILGESLFSLSIGVGFNKSSDDLRQNFNRFLKTIKQNGVYAGMVDRWITKRESRMPEIPAPAQSSGVIVAGVTSGSAPFTFIQDNQMLGFDIELVKRFGAFLGKEVKFSDMEFGGLIAAVASQKVDLIAASIYITDERKKQIDFSDSYFEMGCSLLRATLPLMELKPPSLHPGRFLTRLPTAFEAI
jgi:polar amino acid transport system substrate-binding protein